MCYVCIYSDMVIIWTWTMWDHMMWTYCIYEEEQEQEQLPVICRVFFFCFVLKNLGEKNQ